MNINNVNNSFFNPIQKSTVNEYQTNQENDDIGLFDKGNTDEVSKLNACIENYPPGEDEEIGLYELSYAGQLEKYGYDMKFNELNLKANGPRLDKSMENFKIQVGNNEIEILTDNNIVSEKWAKENKQIPNRGIFTDEMKNAISNAVKTLSDNGQKVPKKMYFTNFLKDMRLSGLYDKVSEDSIILCIDSSQNKEWLENTIYHESAHMADYKANNDGKMISETKGINISPIKGEYDPISDSQQSLPTIDFNGKKIDKKYIDELISYYSLKNNMEFVAEVSAMLTQGTIIQTKNGEYTIKTDESGHFKNAHLFDRYITDYENFKIPDNAFQGKIVGSKKEIDKAINEIMELYNYLTEGKVAKAKIV